MRSQRLMASQWGAEELYGQHSAVPRTIAMPGKRLFPDEGLFMKEMFHLDPNVSSLRLRWFNVGCSNTSFVRRSPTQKC